MEENKFWISVWLLVSVVIVSLITAISVVNIDTTKKMDNAIKNGADPLRVSCAYNPNQYNTAVCGVLAAK